MKFGIEFMRSVLSMIPDRFLVSEYARYAAGRLGVRSEELTARLSRRRVEEAKEVAELSLRQALEWEALKVLVQCPEVKDWPYSVEVEDFSDSVYRGAAGIILPSPVGDVDSMLASCTTDFGRDFITRAAVEPLGVVEGSDRGVYGVSVLARLLVQAADAHIFELKSGLSNDVNGEMSRQLVSMANHRKVLLTHI